MNLDVYTQHIPLTQKARFWGNFVSALKGLIKFTTWRLQRLLTGSNDLYAAPEPHIRHYYPSIVETMPGADARMKNEFGRLEDLMWRGRRGTSVPPTPVLAEANDRWDANSSVNYFLTITLKIFFRIHTLGYNYCPVHTEIYGSYRNRDRRAFCL